MFVPCSSVCLAVAAMVLGAPACSGEVSRPGGVGGGTSTTSTSGSGGAAPLCAPTTPASPGGCPDAPTAEAAFSSLEATCSLTEADVDLSDPQNPTLTAAGSAKICSTCDCRTNAFDYYALYMSCSSTQEVANAALAKNIYAVAANCGH
jgi:hypothetical protein